MATVRASGQERQEPGLPVWKKGLWEMPVMGAGTLQQLPQILTATDPERPVPSSIPFSGITFVGVTEKKPKR